MDELIERIQDATGLSTEKATEVVMMVVGYLRDALPEGVVDQALGIAMGAAGTATDIAGSVIEGAKDTLGGILGSNE